MSIDIYNDELKNVWLFGKSVLYTTQPIPREDIPAGWHCYDLRGTVENPARPYELVDWTEDRFAGSILSNVPLKSSHTQGKLFPNLFWVNAIPVTLADHCLEEGIPYPQPVYVAETEMPDVGWGMTVGF